MANRFYYANSQSHQDDLKMAIQMALAYSNLERVYDAQKRQAWEDAYYYLTDHARFNDGAYLQLMVGLMDQIEVNNSHPDTDEAVLFTKLLYTDGEAQVKQVTFAQLVEELKNRTHPTLREIGKVFKP
ncbi:MAG: hypothetical protein AAFV80_06540 [Bacteroidota bacterium]